ncbi:MAG: tRNA preQ1(34) S-adenosylmethionine ribosyltransferase-isomerase QueA [Chloroflexi bacterium]|nr:tRNA preQ1(34) S-adenosylmethionine ribosyltransferase-isomerase QueA [Chloroflexota bacterium]
MLTSDFDYLLPPEQIAQHPIEPRDRSRLLVMHRDNGRLEHRTFSDLVELLVPGDVLVANDTRVIPARLMARKDPSGGKVELLLLSRVDPLRWEALVKGRRADPGQRLIIGEEADQVLGWVEGVTPSGGRLLRFEDLIDDRLEHLGQMPLPPYIHETLADRERYQTVYARAQGSVAAPTAGLHFTPELIDRIKDMGVEWVNVLLHIGLDTFRPVSEERVEDHEIHTEYCELSASAAERLNEARHEGRRIIAIGTTSVRVLETACAGRQAEILPYSGRTRLFIYPGHTFSVVDAMVTNFHLPRSSLLMLVSAFAGVANTRRAYDAAVRSGYRFYSFGDSMFIV